MQLSTEITISRLIASIEVVNKSIENAEKDGLCLTIDLEWGGTELDACSAHPKKKMIADQQLRIELLKATQNRKIF